MRTVDPAQHSAKRAAILGAAAEVFAERGFDGTSTSAVCTAAGIGSGTLFHYFPTKRSLFHAIFAEDTTKVSTFAERLDLTRPIESLRALVAHLAADAGSPHAAGLMSAAIIQARRDPEFVAVLRESETAATEALTHLLRTASAQGLIDESLDPTRSARWIQTLIDALYLRENDIAEEISTLHLIITRYLQINESNS